MFKSATFKLTFYYMAIISAICMLFSVAIYQFATHEVRRGLTNQSNRVIQEFPGFDFDPALRPNWDSSRAAHRLLVSLVEFNLVVLLFGGFASYLLAKQTLRPIEESHRQQQRFTADVSHELRTPLTALKMDTEVALMDEGASKSNLRATLASNLEEATKLESLINNLFKLTRLEASELAQHFTNVDIAVVVADAITDTTQRAKDKKITLENNVKSSEVKGDRTSLTQLVTILLDNAIKYSDKKTVVSINSSSDKTTVSIAVTDHGIGIDAEALDHVFDRFYRADAARTRNDTSGYGLGLSIAKMIADVHGGSITITSEAGKGTTASVELPVVPE